MGARAAVRFAGNAVFCWMIGTGCVCATTYDDLNLIEAAGRGDTRIFKMMLDMGANPQALDMGGNSAVLLAAYHSRRDMVRRLIELNVPVNIKGSLGFYPLGAAAMPACRPPIRASAWTFKRSE